METLNTPRKCELSPTQHDFDKYLKYSYFRNTIIANVREAITEEATNWQQNKTPYSIVDQMIEKTSLDVETILVLFNVEFVERLVYKYGVPSEKIFFFADHSIEQLLVERLYNVRAITGSSKLMTKEEAKKYKDIHPLVARIQEMGQKKFDLVFSNPPYQGPKDKNACGSGKSWDKLVLTTMEMCKEAGHIALVHPSDWRKPEHKLYNEFQIRNLKYLEIHNKADGQKTFAAATRYDWYVLQNRDYCGQTTIKDEIGVEQQIDIRKWDFLPNKEYGLFRALLAKDEEEKCEVIYSRSAYGSDKKHTSKTQTGEFKYPVVYMMTQKDPLKLFYSDTNKNGHFGVRKVITNKQGIPVVSCLYDKEGQYGMTEWVYALKVSSDKEAEGIIEALNSDKFKGIWEGSMWLNVTREWKIFKYFKKDFWKYFI